MNLRLVEILVAVSSYRLAVAAALTAPVKTNNRSTRFFVLVRITALAFLLFEIIGCQGLVPRRGNVNHLKTLDAVRIGRMMMMMTRVPTPSPFRNRNDPECSKSILVHWWRRGADLR